MSTVRASIRWQPASHPGVSRPGRIAFAKASDRPLVQTAHRMDEVENRCVIAEVGSVDRPIASQAVSQKGFTAIKSQTNTLWEKKTVDKDGKKQRFP